MMQRVTTHEVGHMICFAEFGVWSRPEIHADGTGLTIPEPHYLSVEQQLVVYVAGMVAEHLHGHPNVHNGGSGDCELICRLLGAPEADALGYATATALLIENVWAARVIPPQAHIEKLRTAVAEATRILSSNEKFMTEIRQGVTQ